MSQIDAERLEALATYTCFVVPEGDEEPNDDEAGEDWSAAGGRAKVITHIGHVIASYAGISSSVHEQCEHFTSEEAFTASEDCELLKIAACADLFKRINALRADIECLVA